MVISLILGTMLFVMCCFAAKRIHDLWVVHCWYSTIVRRCNDNYINEYVMSEVGVKNGN